MESTRTLDFIRAMVLEDLQSDRHGGRVTTRFPPEPNGYLHIGHAKSICLNFGIPQEFKDQAPAGARCNLRFDDTNPTREEQEYIDAIKRDIRWLGFDWGKDEYYASDYFEQLYEWAIKLIKDGKAYVCDLNAEQIRTTRGNLTQPGTPSPYRDRSVEENLDLFARMRQGEFPDGSRVLRARIDMASPNLNMRDPVMYRILHAKHPRTGGAWCIYPMYDYAHGQSDSIERITHSLCTLEFEDHRPLYDWFIEQLGIFPSRQTEFNRLNLTHTVVTKRKLRTLVEDRHVAGWDDPRMPTLSALRRRGYPPTAIRGFCDAVGLSKREQLIDLSRLEFHVREELNRTANRVMAVLDPLRVVITNYPADQVEEMDAVNNPENPAAGKRTVPFSQVLYIERDDFMENPPGKFFRLAPGREVRLRYGYWVTCMDVIKDGDGNIVELRCTYDPQTRGGDSPPDGRKVKGTIHWVSAAHALDAEVRLYDTLFAKEDPNDVPEGGDWLDNLNPDSLKVVQGAKVEPSLKSAGAGDTFQFERIGYFCVDLDTDKSSGLVFNRTVTLKDSWGRSQKG